MNMQQRALLESLASDPFNGATAGALQLGHTQATIRKLYAAGLIERFTRECRFGPGKSETLTYYRISDAGQQALNALQRRRAR